LNRRQLMQLLEVLMSSVNSDKVPVELGWRVWSAYKNNDFSNRRAYRDLVKACMMCEPEKTKKVLRGGRG